MMGTRYQVIQSGGVFDHTTRSIVRPDKSAADWQAYQSWLTAGNTPLPPDVIGQDDLPTAKEKRMAEIDAYSAGLRNVVVRGRSAGEMAGWSIKLAEARAYLATLNPADAPTLAATATIRGLPLDDLVARVIAQAMPFLQAEAAIDGIRGKHCDAIDAMTDVRDIVVYDWSAGWPTIP